MINNSRFGCQTYAWYMSYEKYKNEIMHITEVIAESGYAGMETNQDFVTAENIAAFKDKLESCGIALCSYGFSLDWLHDDETPEEKRISDDTIAMLVKYFPDTLLMFGHSSVGVRDAKLKEKQEKQIAIVNRVAKRAASAGLRCAYHANSPANAYFRTQEDYVRLLSFLDTSVIGWAPDIGHMAKGKCDIAGLLEKHLGLIRHVHYKDMSADGAWVPMGKGEIDYVGITKLLREGGFGGWIVVEDESVDSELDPDKVTKQNMDYIEKYLLV